MILADKANDGKKEIADVPKSLGQVINIGLLIFILLLVFTSPEIMKVNPLCNINDELTVYAWDPTLFNFLVIEKYKNQDLAEIRKALNLDHFHLLIKAGLAASLFGLITSAVWTLMQTVKLKKRPRVLAATMKVGAILYKTFLPHTDFTKTVLFSTKNFLELLLLTALWIAPLFILPSRWSNGVDGLFWGFYHLAVAVGFFYLFSLWSYLGIYAICQKLRMPGKPAEALFFSIASLFWLFFVYVTILISPLALFVGLSFIFAWAWTLKSMYRQEAMEI